MKQKTVWQKIKGCLKKSGGMKTTIMSRIVRLSLFSVFIVSAIMVAYNAIVDTQEQTRLYHDRLQAGANHAATMAQSGMVSDLGNSDEWLDRLMEEEGNSEMYAFVIDSSDSIVGASSGLPCEKVNSQEMAGKGEAYAGLSEMIRTFRAGAKTSMSGKMPNGRRTIAAFAPVGDSGAAVVFAIDASALQKSFTSGIVTQIIILIVLMIIETVIDIFLSMKIAHPLRVASYGLKLLNEGDLSTAREDVKISKDETGRLLNSFDDTRRQLREYIGDISEVIAQIANGNLRVTVDREYMGDFAQIKESLESIIDSMNKTLGGVIRGISNLNEGAKQVEAASQSLASATTEQASAVVEITASMDNVAKHTQENTRNVMDAEKLVRETKSEAELQNEKMGQLLEAMSGIEEASKNIAKIMKVINDIAFQTNILALNASVEAARAGEHGAGFAVVAGEVRTLAGKSAAAAAEINDMIEDSISKIGVGMSLANDTGESLKVIVDSVEKITSIMGEIANASKQQNEAVSQVNAGIEQISQAVQNNSAISEETAAASVELANQSAALDKKVSFYLLRQKKQS